MITVRDQNGRNPEGIPVQFAGPASGTRESDRNGRVRIEGPPGNYLFEVVPGCTPSVFVLETSRARGNILEGRTGGGVLTVRWQHRIGPGNGAYPSKEPFWVVDDPVTLAYDVIDRCGDGKAPGGAYPTFAFRTTANLEVVGTPVLRANDSGQGHVLVRCRAPGDIRLVLFDSANPPDRVDLIDYAFVKYKEGRLECVSKS